ncbi:HAMP domain-containing histidine kinase [Candidatus Saccharibacteria bacterium]|nr:HAMP domain-containing histidine kinase [Candidatus Saccharibacteria bacterium]MBQ3476331.1 HAMP domain-containing histidine kinase [Candidatus Saccharibacteria bacterium]
MFNNLRNKLIWTNVGITSVVLLVAFSTIYIFATHSADNRPPVQNTEMYSNDMEILIQATIRDEKQAAAKDLLVILIISGISIELIVVLISYYMAEESIKPVRESYESQKVFIANASHEIKTPLAAIMANLEAADIHGNKWIDNVEEETKKLSKLNADLLNLARTDLVRTSDVANIDLTKLTQELIKKHEPLLGTIKTNISLTKKYETTIAKDDYAQIFDILMDNAIKYCDKKIDINLRSHTLVISNDGTIIKNDDAKRIFERFYQVDKTADGVGLGLSIAKSIADRNNWKLTASSTNTRTRFILSF